MTASDWLDRIETSTSAILELPILDGETRTAYLMRLRQTLDYVGDGRLLPSRR